MPTVSFTTRLDSTLKQKLEQIAQYEDRSASYIANKAIQAMIEEREQTRQLIDTGLEILKSGDSISSHAINEWLQASDDIPFPQTDRFAKQ